MCMLFCACSKNYTESEEVPTNNVQIISELKSYNDSLPMSQLTTRSGRAFYVAAIDAGAFASSLSSLLYIGGKILTATGGAGVHVVALGITAGTAFITAGASYGAYKNSCAIVSNQNEFLNSIQNNKNLRSKIEDFNIQADKWVSYNNAESLLSCNDSVFSHIGELHNQILECALDKGLEEITIDSIDSPNPQKKQKKSPVLSENKGLEELHPSSYGLAFFDDEQIKSALNTSLLKDSVYIENKDIFSMLENNKNNGIITDNTQSILSLFFTAYYNSVSDENNMYSLVLHYKNTVKASKELSDIEKQHIMMCLEIAKSSYSFWKNRNM